MPIVSNLRLLINQQVDNVPAPAPMAKAPAVPLANGQIADAAPDAPAAPIVDAVPVAPENHAHGDPHAVVLCLVTLFCFLCVLCSLSGYCPQQCSL